MGPEPGRQGAPRDPLWIHPCTLDGRIPAADGPVAHPVDLLVSSPIVTRRVRRNAAARRLC